MRAPNIDTDFQKLTDLIHSVSITKKDYSVLRWLDSKFAGRKKITLLRNNINPKFHALWGVVWVSQQMALVIESSSTCKQVCFIEGSSP